MAAIIAYAEIGEPYREVLGVEFNTSLVIGQSYHVSFNLVCDATLQNGFAINHLGFKFTTYPTFDSVEMMTNNISHGSISEIVSDIHNWQTFHFTFQADSAYTYFHLGCFFEDSESETELIQFGNVFFSYYFIDNVRIEEERLLVDGDEEFSFLIYPNPVSTEFAVDTPVKHLIRKVTLYDLLGKVVLTFNGTHGTYRVDDLPSGIYLAEFDLEGYRPAVAKILKR